MLSTYEIYPSKLEKSHAIIFTDILSPSEILDLETNNSEKPVDALAEKHLLPTD